MARQHGWRYDDRRFRDRDEDRRDWRTSGDDWRRDETYRSGRGGEESGWSDRYQSRDTPDYGGLDDVRRRDMMGYGGAMGGDYGFARSESDVDPYRRSYGQERFGRGSSYYDRDSDWGFGRRDDDYRRRSYESGWNDDRRSSWGEDRRFRGRDDDRGFFEKASDEVASWFGDEEAERRRQQDQHRGRGPKGYARSDERIREDVSDRLTDDPFVDASEIEVAVSSSEVTLTGTVPSRDQRRRAEDIAERISGVKHVQNNIRVADRSSQIGQGGQTGQTGQNIGQTAFGRDTSTGAVSSGTVEASGLSQQTRRKGGAA